MSSPSTALPPGRVPHMRPRFHLVQLAPALAIGATFWILALGGWLATGNSFPLFNFGYIGTAVGVGMGLYTVLPKRQKPWGRRLAQVLVGAYMLLFFGLYKLENMQIEGFFLYVLAGFFSGAAVHYLVAKVAGPPLFGRAWCSWACWTAMVLDLLPFKRDRAGRVPGRWGWLRYAHFGLSLSLILVLWFGFAYGRQDLHTVALAWLVAGNSLYYGVGIAMAFVLRDNRAFCKYVCPIPAIQKLTSRFALLKVTGDAGKCNECGACAQVCPMDIRISDYIMNGQRVGSTECILCLTCTTACPTDALRLSFGFDRGQAELLRTRDRATVHDRISAM